MSEVFRIKDAIPCDCEARSFPSAFDGSDNYPMFPYYKKGDMVTYKCGACGKEKTLSIYDLRCEKSVWGYLFNSEGYFGWKCPIHGVNEYDIPEEPNELSEKLLKSVEKGYLQPCCFKLKRNVKKLSFEQLYKIHGDINDNREEKWLSGASKEELVAYLEYVIEQKKIKGQEYYWFILPKNINRNKNFWNKEVLTILYKSGFLDDDYERGYLSDSKMVAQAIKHDSVEALEFFEERGYFKKEKLTATCKRNAEKYNSTNCIEWLKKY